MLHALHAAPGEAVARAVDLKDVAGLVNGPGVLWVDLEDPTEEEAAILSSVFRFHPLAIEDCVAETNHAKVDDYGDYVYLVVHGVKRPDQRGPLDTEEVDFFLGRAVVVTYHTVPVKVIEEVRRRCLEVPNAMRAADFLVHAILDRLVDSYVTKMEALDAEIDALEQRLFRRNLVGRAVLNEIFALKKEVLQLKRVVNPQREVMNRFARREFGVVSVEAAPHFRDVFDHVYRVSEMVESFRDVVTSAMETYLTVVANRTNEVMKVLTVLSAVLMSASLLAGIYGMNFTVLPGKDWPGGFWASIGLMAAVSGVMVAYFRTRRWI
ncbi:MAG: magnesium/cobalt transporter CorA [Planctomycetes bacterium]|nr:magnesium/cobalt transporter CorA [Planctomycetota bacterium]